MKLLVIGSVYPRSAEDHEVPWLRASIAHLRQAGCSIRVLAPAWKGLGDHVIDDVPVYRFRYAPAALEVLTHDEGAPSKMASRPWMQLLAIPYILNGFIQCLRLCLRDKPDVIHAHWPFPHGLIALGACKLLRIPLVLNFHGAELLLIRKHGWVRPVLHFILGQSRLVFANSSFTAKRIQEIRSVPVELSPYGTTLSCSGSLAPCLAGSPFRVLFVGRHIERKGIATLIRAAASLDPSEYQIRIVGKGDLTTSLQEQARLEASAQVVFTGPLTPQELEREYREAHAFVLPAIVDSKGDTEGLGVVLIEAAEYHLPLVASAVGGIPDVVDHNRTGLLVPPGNPEALAQAITQLKMEPGLRERLVTGAHELINTKFSWSGIVARQVSAYRKVLNA